MKTSDFSKSASALDASRLLTMSTGGDPVEIALSENEICDKVFSALVAVRSSYSEDAFSAFSTMAQFFASWFGARLSDWQLNMLWGFYTL